MRLKWFFAVLVLLVGALLAGPALAQDSPSGSTNPDQPSAEAPSDDDGKKWPFALYIHASTGTGGADPFENSIATGVTTISQGVLEIDEINHSKSALGWKLPQGKGDFRLAWTSLKEEGFKFSSRGLQNQLAPGQAGSINDNLLWWSVNAENGVLRARRTPPLWDLATDDLNGNGSADFDEVDSSTADFAVERPFVEDLQNRAQFIDALYGREFGRRRFSSRWWSGVRYSVFEGNVLAGAWLSSSGIPGAGFTDGSTMNLMNYYQKASGFGPTGSLSLDVNFFDKRLSLYVQGQAAFMIMNVESDSGPFITQVGGTAGTTDVVNLPNSLAASRNKSTWQDSLEAGVRVRLKNGLEIEVAYSIIGMLDVVLMPSAIRIPDTLEEGPGGTSAVYNTQDFVMDTVRAGIGFQF